MKQLQEVHITVSNRTLFRIVMFFIVTLVALRFIAAVRHPLTLIFVAFFLALAISPLVSAVKRHLKMKSRSGATAVAYCSVLVLLGSFFALVIPPLVDQTNEFLQGVPARLESLESQDNVLGDIVRNNNLQAELDDLAANVSSNLSDVSGPAFSIANRIVSNIISIVTVLILTFMMLVEGPDTLNWLLKQFPKKRAERLRKLANRMSRVVTNYVNGQVIIAGMSGFFALIALVVSSSLLGVNINALALAALVTVFALIPTIGSYINAALITLVCLFSSTTLAIIMLVYFIVYQQIENATIQPYIQSKSNDLTALTVFIAALLGLGFGGILGGFVAIPVAGCAKLLLEDWLDDRQYNASNPTKADT